MGSLRAVINLGNAVLAGTDVATGAAKGVTVDISNELARRIGKPVSFVTVPNAAKSVEVIGNGSVDVGFFAIDPTRAQTVTFSPPYVVIEGAYVVRNDSPIRANAEVDRAGIQIAAAKGSAYDLYLSRELKNAKIVHAITSQAVVDTFVAQKLDVAAGVKQQLEIDVKRISGLRLLDGRFMVINQAMGTPAGRDAAAKYVTDFIEELKASGFIARALERHKIQGAAVAPPGMPR